MSAGDVLYSSTVYVRERVSKMTMEGGGGISTKVVGVNFLNSALVLILSFLLVLKGKSFSHPF